MSFFPFPLQCAQVTVLVAKTWSEGDGSEFPTSATMFQYLGTLEKYQQNSGDGKSALQICELNCIINWLQSFWTSACILIFGKILKL